MRAYAIPRPATAFSKSPMKGKRRPRQHADKHLEWIRTLPCVVTGTEVNIEAAHIRYADPIFGKRETGLAEKPSDMWTVPLNAGEHRLNVDAQHAGNEREYWRRHRIDPVKVAAALWANSGDTETALVILRETWG